MVFYSSGCIIIFSSLFTGQIWKLREFKSHAMFHGTFMTDPGLNSTSQTLNFSYQTDLY